MDSSMIGKIEKAKRYAKERERFKFQRFTVSIQGTNNDHVVQFADGKFNCDCEFFKTRGICSHTMAIEELLKDMLPRA